ncbi:MAG: PhoH family protein [candidate division KSB1 bacterium]|nr:PhoH family protein [candidate division KSB1 bacterium]
MNTNTTAQKKISLKGIDPLGLLGFQDSHLKLIEKSFDATIVVRGSEIFLQGKPQEVGQLERLFTELIFLLHRNNELTEGDIKTTIQLLKDKNEITEKPSPLNSVILYTKTGFIRPKTPGQEAYYRSAQKNDIVFVIGPAGTGKTYLAVAIALAHLRDKQVERLVLARPAVEAGESLGFLPGDIKEKVDPYLRPLYDALFDMLIPEKLKKYVETRIIEIVPLAYMRGRTLNNAYVILDEAQNTSANQMKMFLTRLGVNSRAIITGDITQIDLPDKQQSGLVQIQDILKGIDGIDFVYLTESDVVRHRLVREIIKAYDAYNGNQRK